MSHVSSQSMERNKDSKPLLKWLWSVYGMICVMIVVGGTTRLTGSGLSMVEWRPLMGTLPPLTTEEWSRVFDMYKASPQYLTVNSWMTLSDFKVIFFWEYLHRLIGRLIGLVYFIPMVVLWLRGHLIGRQRTRALIALALGGGQGVLGWYMVKSGLVDIPAVSHFRLAAHLSLAFFLGSYILYWILDLKGVKRPVRRLSGATLVFLGLLALQIVYGAFVAGTRAGYMYTSFPLLNGSLLPSGGWLSHLGVQNLVENRELLNAIHRWLAIALTVFGLWLARLSILGREVERQLNSAGRVFGLALLTQVGLGIVTAAMRVPATLGALHQISAFLLLSATLWFHHSRQRSTR